MLNRTGLFLSVVGLSLISTVTAAPPDSSRLTIPAAERFAAGGADETPNFRRHIVPLLGKLGCNSRACHGSFQGQGGFRLSLFGYDFKMDHEGLIDRVDTDDPPGSYAIQKALLEEPHRGGKRFDRNSWQHHLFVKWIETGAHSVDVKTSPRFERLEITPREIRFRNESEKVQLKVVSVWSDGSREDVTCLSRFQTNDEVVAEVSSSGEVSSQQSGDTHIVVFYDNGVHPVPVIRPISPRSGENYPVVTTSTPLDEIVVEKLTKLGVLPSSIAGDAEFLRRLSLDMTGTLPTPEEIQNFAASTDSQKRAQKIDELLNRPTYAAWWATRFADWTGNSDDQLNNAAPVRSMAARDWYEWIRVRLERNEPYDRIAEGFVLAGSREKNESYQEYCENMAPLYAKESRGSYADRSTMPHYWARQNFRTPEDRAIGFAYNFLGIRIQCAQCHKHPFDQWTMDDFHQFKNFFVNTRFRGSPESRKGAKTILEKLGVDANLRGNQLRRELRTQIAAGEVTPFEEVWTTKPAPPKPVRRDKNGKVIRSRERTAAGSRTAKLLGEAEQTDLSQFEDPRQPLMDWLRDDSKQLFARSIVNRIWSCYFNVGIVEPPDDLSLANPPSNAALLDYLATGFVANGYDLKWVHREITRSDTYQRTWIPNETNLRDDRNFSHSIPRRMPAEVAMDALVAATSSDDAFAEQHTSITGRNIALVSAGSRYNENPRNYALSVFGRSIRESNCDCDRSQEPSLLQTVFLQNDSYIYDLMDRGRGGWINQVASDLEMRQTRVAVSGRSRSSTSRLVAGFQAQIKRAKAAIRKAEEDDNSRLADQNRRRLAGLKKRIADLAGSKNSEGAELTQKADPEKLQQVVRETYLRTLSREPVETEIQKALAYIQASDNQLHGVRDVLWALLNTKEFIVNH